MPTADKLPPAKRMSNLRGSVFEAIRKASAGGVEVGGQQRCPPYFDGIGKRRLRAWITSGPTPLVELVKHRGWAGLAAGQEGRTVTAQLLTEMGAVVRDGTGAVCGNIKDSPSRARPVEAEIKLHSKA